MAKAAQHSAGKTGQRSGTLLGKLVVASIVVLIVVAAVAVLLVFRPPFARPALEMLGLASPSASASSETPLAAQGDAAPTGQEREQMETYEKQRAMTPIVATCSGIELHSPIRPVDLTGILFHQSATKWAFVLETELPEADYETVASARSMRINHAQEGGKQGAWLDAEALHLWRTADYTDMDTSIDIGALAGTTVVSPVSGTVIHIREYTLYDELPDIEIHIQPDGHPELDVVLIHTENPTVKAGDRVEAGVTPISHIRDIESKLTDVQLGFFTPEGVGGNHVHVQVNDIDYPGYREQRLDGAKIPGANASASAASPSTSSAPSA